MKKDYIVIANSDGILEKMEVIATFKLQDTNKDYIFYKTINNSNTKYFAASFNLNSKYSELSTDLTDKEKKELNIIFEVLNSGGDISA